MADAEMIGRDGTQLVLDVWKSGRQDVIRDELLMAKTVDMLVENAVRHGDARGDARRGRAGGRRGLRRATGQTTEPRGDRVRRGGFTARVGHTERRRRGAVTAGARESEEKAGQSEPIRSDPDGRRADQPR